MSPPQALIVGLSVGLGIWLRCSEGTIAGLVQWRGKSYKDDRSCLQLIYLDSLRLRHIYNAIADTYRRSSEEGIWGKDHKLNALQGKFEHAPCSSE